MKTMLIAFLLLAPWSGAFAKDSKLQENDQLRKASMVMNEIMQTPDKGIPNDLLDKAVCVGIVPSEIKAAFGVGGTYGKGVLVCREHGNGHWGAPSLFTLGGGSFGFQIGAKATDVVFLVMNQKGAQKLLQDKVKLGADASVAAGPVGRTAAGETDLKLNAQILSYSRSRGAFAGVESLTIGLGSPRNQQLPGKAEAHTSPAGQPCSTTAQSNPNERRCVARSFPLLLAFLVATLLVVLHNRPSSDLLRALAVSPGLLRAVLDVLVFPLFFIAHTA